MPAVDGPTAGSTRTAARPRRSSGLEDALPYVSSPPEAAAARPGSLLHSPPAYARFYPPAVAVEAAAFAAHREFAVGPGGGHGVHRGGGHGLTNPSGYAFFRGSQAYPPPLGHSLRRSKRPGPLLVGPEELPVSGHRLRFPPAAIGGPFSPDLVYYGATGPATGQFSPMMVTQPPLERRQSGRGGPPGSAGGPLCRCGSGGALPQQPGSPPLGHAAGCGVGGGGPSFRAAQSLPSTPNTCRRPLSPQPPLSAARPAFDLGPPPPGRGQLVGFSGPLPDPLNPLPPPPPSAGGPADPFPWPLDPCPQQVTSESAILAEEPLGGPPTNGRHRAMQQWAAQRRSLRYRSSSQPLMKLSTLVIVVIAIIIIGFIVLSPLFHYFM